MVTPSYNQARFLEDAILSVLNQGYPDLEFMVMDGGSTDGSVDIISKYADRLAYWESKADRGQAQAINKGWRKATGKYLWWLNSDDMLTQQSLTTAIRHLEENPDVDMVYGDVLRIDQKGCYIDTYRYRDFDLTQMLLHRYDIAQAGALIRSKLLEQIGYLDESLHYLMDLDYWIRLGLAGGRIVHLPIPLAFFRIHGQSKTQASSEIAAYERYQVTEAFLGHPNLPHAVGQRRGTVWSYTHLACSRAHVKSAGYRQAMVEICRALRRWPLQVLRMNFWYTAALSLLGIMLGEYRWTRLRSVIRRLRQRKSPWST